MRYEDSTGRSLNVSGGDHVKVFGWDGDFETVDIRPEGVAVIRNLAPGYNHTSSVPVRLLTIVSEAKS